MVELKQSKSKLYHFSFEKKSIYILLKYLWDKKWIYLAGVGFILGTSLTQVYVARSLGWILDYLTHRKIPQFLVRINSEQIFLFLFFSLVAARLILMFSRMGWRITMGRQTHYAGAALRNSIWRYARFFQLKIFQQDLSKGELMNISNSDINTARFLFGWTLVALVDVLFLGIFTVWAMFNIDVYMTLGAVVGLILLPYFIKKLTDLEAKRFRKAQESLSAFNDLCSQVIATIRLQRVTQSERFWQGRLFRSAGDYRVERLKAVYTSLGYVPLMGGVTTISYLILFSFGVYRVFSGLMSVGDFVAMQSLVFLLQDPLMELGFIVSDYKRGSTSLARINDVFGSPKEEALFLPDQGAEDPKAPVFQASNISFSYDGHRHVIKNLNLELRKGDRLGIIGKIGSGKSTLLNILSGVERNYSGKVVFKGATIDQYSHQTLRKSIGFVPQKPFLFAASIRENVCMDNTLTDDEVWYYLNLSGLESDVKNFQDGLDTELGEWGINLSGGQKQRLTLARTLARKPDVIFLDDCLSAVDTVTEEKILANINEYLKGTTLIWVAHRKSTLKYCQRILELS